MGVGVYRFPVRRNGVVCQDSERLKLIVGYPLIELLCCHFAEHGVYIAPAQRKSKPQGEPPPRLCYQFFLSASTASASPLLVSSTIFFATRSMTA